MFKCTNFFLLLLGLSVNICVSAPVTSSSSSSFSSMDTKTDTSRLTSESNQIKASLDQILASMTSDKIASRSVTDAVIILQQVLKQAHQNTNPLLSQAVVKALLQLDEEYEEDPATMTKLGSFLENLKDQVSLANFPLTFSSWLNNHVSVVQTAIRDRSTTTTPTSLTQPGHQHHHHHDNQVLDDDAIKEKIERFKLFIQDGLQNLVRQETLNTIQVGKVNKLLNSEEFESAIVSMIVDEDEGTENDEQGDSSGETLDSSQENYSLNVVQALKQVYDRASPDLQPLIASVLRALEKNGQEGRGSTLLNENSISQGF